MYKGQQVDLNFGQSSSGDKKNAKSMKLDMRFADDEDAGDIECVLEIADSSEYDENSHFYCRMANASRPGAASRLNVRVNKAQITQDCNTAHTQWIVMETPVPEEQVVGAARLLLGGIFDANNSGGPKKAVVDMLACIPDTQQQSVRAQMLAQLERIAVGQGAEILVIEVIQHRTDQQDWLESCGYEELGGRGCEEDGLLKATMIFEFHKNLRHAKANSAGSSSLVPLSDAGTAAPPPAAMQTAPAIGKSVAMMMSASQGKSPITVPPPAPAPESAFDLDLASLSLEDFEIVSSGSSGGESSQPKDIVSGDSFGGAAVSSSAASADPMRSAISDLFSALHKEHGSDVN